MIIAAMPFITLPLSNIFNAILCSRHYPKEWKLGIIVNLYKAGNTSHTDNYRGLTINSCLAKVFNMILNNRLVKFLDEKNIISDFQIGFRKKARTSDHLFVINTIFRKFTSMKKDVYLCFVDFRKAYDSVWREALLLKLLRIGIKGNFFGVIESMYQDCESCIRTQGMLSNFFKCETGVRQGDVMSPNLFNIYVNDLPEIFNKDTDSPKLGNHFINCLMYADDLVLLSLSADGLQKKLIKLNQYCQKWDLEINISKTKLMVMSIKKDKCQNEKLTIGGIQLEWVEVYKYLGVEVHSNGDLLAASKNLCARGWKAVFKMQSAFKGLDVNPLMRIRLFNILVRPIITYGSEVWGAFTNLSSSKSLEQFWQRLSKLPVENFQLKFCKGVLSLHSKTSNAAVLGELGQFPIFIYIMKSMLRYFEHLNKVKNERPLLAAASSEDDILVGNKSWKGNINKILAIFGLSLSSEVRTEILIEKMINIMNNKYIEHWKKMVGNRNDDSGKLHLYRKIKNNYIAEPYLSQIKKNKFRRSMTALRISAHKLEIETGRYTGKKGVFVVREERYCTLCQRDGIEVAGDENHALLECPSFQYERQQLMDFICNLYPNFTSLSDHNKIIFMLTCENQCLHQVSKYVHKVLSCNRPHNDGK